MFVDLKQGSLQLGVLHLWIVTVCLGSLTMIVVSRKGFYVVCLYFNPPTEHIQGSVRLAGPVCSVPCPSKLLCRRLTHAPICSNSCTRISSSNTLGADPSSTRSQAPAGLVYCWHEKSSSNSLCKSLRRRPHHGSGVKAFEYTV